MKIQDDNENYRQLCFKCMRPISSCYCKYTAPINCGIKFVFLMHPKEAKKQRTGTGRLACLCLPESEILMVLSRFALPFTRRLDLQQRRI